MTDDRHLFGDEQSYIAWKRQQEAEAKAAARKAALSRGAGRRGIYTRSQRKLMQKYWGYAYRKRIYADSIKHAAYRAHWRELKQRERALHPERQKIVSARYYQKHRDEKLLYQAVYSREHREEIAAKRRDPNYRQKDAEKHRKARAENPEKTRMMARADYVKHREERLAYYRTYRAARRDELSAKKRAYLVEHRDEINARRRATKAAKKAAKQNQSQDAS